MRLLWSSSIALAATVVAGTAMLAQEIRNPAETVLSHYPAGPMTIRLGRRAASPACGLDCAEFIYAEGDITRDSAEKLMVLASRLKNPLPVYVHSAGGSLEGGLSLGNVLRRGAMPVVVARMQPLACTHPAACGEADQRAGVTVFADQPLAGLCHSACAYSFAGGTARHLPQGSLIGVHQFFVARTDDKTRRPLSNYSREDFVHLQKTVAVVAAYLADKGVGVDLLSLAAEVDPATIRPLSFAEAKGYRLASGQETPFAAPAAFVRLPGAPVPDRSPTGSLPRLPASLPPAAAAPVPLPAPALAGNWPVVERGGKPFAVLAMPSASRRFGDIDYEMTIGCGSGQGRYLASFREIVPSRPSMIQDATVLVGPPQKSEKLAPWGPISRETVLQADRAGVLELEVTSSSTAGYPMRLEFPGSGLKTALDQLDRRCITG
jgi:hypothetical protein